MGVYDRDYGRAGAGKPPGILASLTPVVRGLIFLNLGVYLADMFAGNALRQWGSFRIGTAIFEGQVWEFLTFQFLHYGLLHILMNMLALFFFGPWLERAWGSSRFIAYYLLCGVGGALFFCLLAYVGIVPHGALSSLVGASAGIYGILAGISVIAPDQRVSLLFPPVTLTMRQLALGLMALSTFLVITRWGGNTGGEAGHLGGILMGFLLALNPSLLNWTSRRDHDVKIIRPKAFKRRGEAKLRPRSSVDTRTETEVDRILDKIHREGVQSLTQAERDVLYKASQEQKPKP